MVKLVQRSIWLVIFGCVSKHPSLKDLTLPSDPQTGSIAAREKVLRAFLAVENNELDKAKQLFSEAHDLDPHPTIERLAFESLHLTSAHQLETPKP